MDAAGDGAWWGFIEIDLEMSEPRVHNVMAYGASRNGQHGQHDHNRRLVTKCIIIRFDTFIIQPWSRLIIMATFYTLVML